MMLTQSLYYTVKPYMPWRARMMLRRVAAHRRREHSRQVWPINATASRPPEGWPGWPDGHRFAVVLTHDVEGPEGLAKCRQLAELELEMGFRSSFNFIPDGDYQVSAGLRSWLTEQGFEVGVHDLHHDGKLFASENGFRWKARRINAYLKEWGAAGFRSGFMLRNLDWLHQLEIEYDASTFDSDPFELQSNGTGTIFPFWQSPPAGTGGRGYVELPYTLAQDSTLFLVLRERSPAIWLRKLDWLAEHGGMALVNVHPDYINFGHAPRSAREYPVEYYREFLAHLRSRYQGQFWNPQPRQLARWFTAARKAAPVQSGLNGTAHHGRLAGKRAAVLLYSNYPADPRPRRAAQALIEAGMTVDLLCLSEKENDLRQETVQGVNVFRVAMQRSRASRLTYFWQYGRFLLSAFWFLARRGLVKKYDLVHVHNMPDVLAFSTLVPKLRGSRVILDLHDPMPELMTTIYNLDPEHWFVALLRRLERWSIGFSDLAMTPNLAFKKLFASRSCAPEKIEIVMNSPQPEIFDPNRFQDDPLAGATEAGEFRVMHHGSIVHRHGIDLLVEAVARVRPQIPGIKLDIYGSATPFLETVLDGAKRIGVGDIVAYHGSKSQAEIAVAIRRCHLGVVPNRYSVFTAINFPTRLFEYLSMYRPIVAPRTAGIQDYFTEAQMLMFEPENVDDLAAKILWVYQNREEAQRMVNRGLEVYRANLWPHEKKRFVQRVATLLGVA